MQDEMLESLPFGLGELVQGLEDLGQAGAICTETFMSSLTVLIILAVTGLMFMQISFSLLPRSFRAATLALLVIMIVSIGNNPDILADILSVLARDLQQSSIFNRVTF